MQTYPNNIPSEIENDFLLSSELTARTIRNLRTGRFGSFAACIGDAANVADSTNLARIIKAFPELFWIASEL